MMKQKSSVIQTMAILAAWQPSTESFSVQLSTNRLLRCTTTNPYTCQLAPTPTQWTHSKQCGSQICLSSHISRSGMSQSSPRSFLRRKTDAMFGGACSCRRNLQAKLRRMTMILMATFVIWCTGTIFSTLPAYSSSSSSTTTTATPLERLLQKTSPNVNTMIDHYVQQHMWDDETYDPTKSLYVEAYHDATYGSHPSKIREISAKALGPASSGTRTAIATGERGVTGGGFGTWLSTVVGNLQKRFGLSEMASMSVLAAAFVLAGPVTFLGVGMIVGGMSKRNINRIMKQRYGDSYSVDATIKTEDEVEAPDDEEDDDEEEDDDDDDDDDDEDTRAGKKE